MTALLDWPCPASGAAGHNHRCSGAQKRGPHGGILNRAWQDTVRVPRPSTVATLLGSLALLADPRRRRGEGQGYRRNGTVFTREEGWSVLWTPAPAGADPLRAHLGTPGLWNMDIHARH